LFQFESKKKKKFNKFDISNINNKIKMDPQRRRLEHILRTVNPSVSIEGETLDASPTKGVAKSDDDVVIVSALRTPLTKAKRGGFKDTHITHLLAAVLQATVEKTKLDPKLVNDIVVGNVLCPGGGATQARMAMFLAGFPEEVPITTVNRQCSSGLQAVANVASSIKNHVIDIGIACGMESMSSYDMMGSVGEISPKVFENEKAKQCLMGMGETSENVAERYGITREEQDQMSYESQFKAARAQKEGKFDQEIIPVTTTITTPEGQTQTITVTKDDGIRATTMESLSKLKAAFKPGGSTTAGNSSQVTDGAAAVLMMRRSVANKLGYKPLGRIISYAVVGVPPDVMGIGPAFAIPEALKKANLTVQDIDVYEINEAFASQATYCIKKLGVPKEKLNPNGGAIALGHPLGCTGARQVATLMSELKRSGKRYGVISMCIGTGMGAAGVFELEN
jgi:acetyl-CoA acyltransferase 1